MKLFKTYIDAIKKIISSPKKVNNDIETLDQLNEDIKVIKSAFDDDIIDLEEYLQQLKVVKDKISNLKKEQNYADAIIYNHKGEILFLRRGLTDDFQPGVWGLPGGKVDPGETPEQAVVREVSEETALTVESLQLLAIKKIGNGTIFYFAVKVEEKLIDPSVILDNEEHTGKCFANREKWNQMNLIMDLGETLNDIIKEDKMNPNFHKVVIMRHGYTMQDKEKINSGQDDSTLIPEGIKAANMAAIELGKQGVKKIYLSPLLRAKQTAEIIKQRVAANLIEDDMLSAWDIGDFEGTPKKEFDEKYYLDNPNEKTPNGESFNQFRNRIVFAYNQIIDRCEDGVAILSHSKNMRVWMAIDKNGYWNEQAKQDFLDNKIGNTEVWIKEPAGCYTLFSPLHNEKDAFIFNFPENDIISHIQKAHEDTKTGLIKLESESKDGEKKVKWASKKEIAQLIKQAKNAPQKNLETVIKEHPHPKVREVAHQELDRRDKEEKVQKEEKTGYEAHPYHGKNFKYNKETDSFIDDDGVKADKSKLHEYNQAKHKELSERLDALTQELDGVTKSKDGLHKKLVGEFYKKIEKAKFPTVKDKEEAHKLSLVKLEKMGLKEEHIDSGKLDRILNKKFKKSY